MNLDRISIKVSDDLFMTLAKISDFSKLYTTIWVKDLTMQKINTGNSIQAFSFKNIEQFKGLRPFQDGSQDEISLAYSIGGAKFSYETKLHSGDLVRYNGLKYVVLGIVVNTYAQWNMPTPLLFNPTNVNNDYKSLYGSKLTREQINKKINDNFQSGKYDADMVIPLVDANDFSEYITIIQPRPTKEEVQLMFDSVKAEKDLTIKSQKDVFIDTMLRLRGNEINQIKEVNEDLFKGVQTLLLSVNKAVNEQIELLPEAPKEKPARKPRAKKVIEEVEPVIGLPKGKFEVMSVSYFDSKFKSTYGLYEHLRKKFKKKTQTVAFEVPIYIEYSDAGDWLTKKESFIGSIREPEGNEFNFETMSSNDFLVMLDTLFPQYDWDGFNDKAQAPEVEPATKKDELPDSFDIARTLVKDFPKGLYELTIYEALKQSTQTIAEIMNSILIQAVAWKTTTDGADFWRKINDGDLTEFKQKYGAKGELAIKMFKDFMEKRELQEIKDKQEVKAKPVVADKYTATAFEGKAIKHTLSDTTFSDEIELFVRENEKKGFEVIVDFFRKGKLERQVYKTKKPVEKPKPVPVEKPKPVAKPVAKPKPVKVTKPKVEDDLSFLDDLDNIF
jgi:hypothetical protein